MDSRKQTWKSPAEMCPWMSTIEAIISELPQTIQTAISANNASLLASWDLRLQSFLEQFRREQYFVGGGDQTADPVA